MGYRASIKNINSIGHLIEGNIYTFFEQTISSYEMFYSNMELLEELILRTNDRFYMSDVYWRYLEEDLWNLRKDWDSIKERLRYIIEKYERFESDQRDCLIKEHEDILDYLLVISRLFSRCKVKAIL